MKVSITTSVVNGLFKRNRNLILDAIKSFNNSEVVVTFEKPKKKRSNNQNQFYWGVCIPLIQSGLKDATGEFRTAENIHYKILLPLFAPTNEIVNTETGECISEKLSSSEMTTTQFCEYILEIQNWASEFLSIDIPSPNENLEIFFN
jgi:hypothetical protein